MMLKRLQSFMRRSVVYKAIFEAEELQYSSRDEAIADLQAQLAVSTATWGLTIYEYEYGIKSDKSKSVQARRSAIIAKMRGAGKFTATLVYAIVSAFTDKVSRVTFTGRIRISFNDLTNVDMAAIAAALEEVKPAHLDVEYDMGNGSALIIADKVLANQRRYHTISELRIGMKLLKYQREVML
ncbi:MAG TPA: putative phage tail protein [Brevibacillus sp.]|nr:putative phage tail protein [Brevibacillus sp.]